MSVIKISQLPAKTTPPVQNDLLAIVDSIEVVTKKISIKNLFTNSVFTGTVTIDNLNVIGAITADIDANNVNVGGLLTLATGPAVNTILTDFSGSSASSLATQKAIKDYVDSKVGLSDTLAEVLNNGNQTLGTNIVVTATDSILVNTIVETTADAGVTIDSVLLKDGLVSGRNVSTDGTKLDTIETGADVTDFANVQAAGALMDSELTDIAAVKALDQGVSTTDSPTFTTLILDDGTGSVGIGDSALSGNTGSSNTAIGDLTLDAGGSGGNNTALGRAALTSNTTGTQNTGLGRSSLLSNADGDANTAVGVQALELNVSGDSNTGIGVDSLEASTGNQNSGLGRLSGSTLASGNNNTFVGYNAQPSSTTVSNEVTIGDVQVDTFRVPGIGLSATASALTFAGTIDGRDVSADGSKLDGIEPGADVTDATNVQAAGALMDSELTNEAAVKALDQGVATTDSPTFVQITVDDGTGSTGVGDGALSGNTGSSNVAFGNLTLDAGGSGGNNSAVGRAALTSNTTGTQNTGIGRSALLLNADGDANTALGASSLDANVSGDSNTGLGVDSLGAATGSQNTAVGRLSGSTLTTGQNNTLIGYNAQPSSVTVSNEITLGDGSVDTFRIPGIGISWTASTFTYAGDIDVDTVTANDLTLSDSTPVINLFDTDGSGRTVFQNAGGITYLTNYGATSGTYGLFIMQSHDHTTAKEVIRADNTNIQFKTDGTLRGRFLLNGDYVLYNDAGTSTDFYWDASTSRLGLGTSSPAYELHIEDAVGGAQAALVSSTTGASILNMGDTANAAAGKITYDNSSNSMFFTTGGSDRARIDGSGNILFGATDTSATSFGAKVLKDGSASEIFAVHRQATDGDFIQFARGGNDIGSIGADSGDLVIDGASSHPGIRFVNSYIQPRYNGAASNGGVDLGSSAARFKDLYLSGGLRADTLTFSNLAGTERARIDSSGRVGINTSSPTEQLHVIGKMYLEDAYSSVGIGQSALSGSTGLNNVAVGRLALDAGDTGGQNTAVGSAALTSNTSGNLNTAVGRSALLLNTTGTTNTAIGAQALLDMVSANGCTAVGYRALYNATNGLNTAIGREAGDITTTGQNNSSLGYNANPSSATASNQVTLGNTSIASLRCAVTSITSISDERDKDNIQPLSAGIDFINELNPVSFTWNCRDGSKVGQSEIGFTAQQLQQAQQNTGIEIPNLVFDDNPDKLEATYGALIPVIVKALKDLKAENDDLKARLSALEA